MSWRALGRIFPSRGYAALPFAVAGAEHTARVLYSGRDARNRSYIGECSLDLDRFTVTHVRSEPLLTYGEPGAFDESGCSMSCIVENGGRIFLYYTGWMLGRTVPFYLAAGLAVSDDGGRTFVRLSRAPLLDRNDADPFLTASPFVMIEDDLWRMWYVSALEWEVRASGPRHRYLIKYAQSKDGISWQRTGQIALPFEGPDEYAMGRPHVIRDGGKYTMWTCVRGERYRLVRAESEDGMHWTRTERPAAPPPSEWDSEMQAYPMLLRDGERSLLFYNGNGYGATGFGCAIAEDET